MVRLPEWVVIGPASKEGNPWPHAVQQASVAEGKWVYESVTREWSPYRAPVQCLSKADYELFTSAAVASGYLRDVLPYDEGAIEWKHVDESIDTYGESLFYWYYLSSTDVEGLSLDARFCHLLRAGVDDAYVVLLMSLLTNVRRISLPFLPDTTHALPWARALQRYSDLREFTVIPESHYENGFFQCHSGLTSWHCHLSPHSQALAAQVDG